MDRNVSQRELPWKSCVMLLLPSTTSQTVGVTGDVFCIPEAQLSIPFLVRVPGAEGSVAPPLEAPAAPALPTTKLSPGAREDEVGLDPEPLGAVLMEVAPALRFAALPPVVSLRHAANETRPTITAGSAQTLRKVVRADRFFVGREACMGSDVTLR